MLQDVQKESKVPSGKCNLTSSFVTVKGSKMHYIESGKGDPVLFVHGMPTSSYLWRNIIPSVSDVARGIAVDLIGMGKSDKPDIEYRVLDHIEYFDEFVSQLKLKNITLVLHGWGSVIGFEYARRHESNVKGIAFYEAHLQPETNWNTLSLPVQQFATLLHRPGASYRAIIKQNYLVEKLLPRSAIRTLTEEEMENYRQPFSTPESRKPLWQYIQDLPLGDGPDDVLQLISRYSAWLQKIELPKLMFYAIPGFMTTIETVKWARTHLKNLKIEALDDAMHLAQESIPELFSQKLREWYLSI